MYDWDCEIDTSKPEYYKWTQWLFLQLYKNGLLVGSTSKEGDVQTNPEVQASIGNNPPGSEGEKRYLSGVPMYRLGRPEEVAAATEGLEPDDDMGTCPVR